MNDDDVLRRALHGPTEPISSYRVLQDLRPTMRRARHRRRAAVAAAAALLLVGGGAGVLALASAPGSPTVRTTSSEDENGAIVSTLPPVSEPSDMVDTDTPAVPTTAAAPIPIEPPALAPAVGDQPGVPEAPETTSKPGSPGVAPPSDELPPATPATTAAPTPAAPAAPPQPAGPTSQVLTSACGDVVVEIDERTVTITSIAPLPGYTPQVSTDGPESVEMKFLGTGDSCEIHAELKASGLDVEIQNSDHDD